MSKNTPNLSNNRLDIENISPIAAMFRENITVLKWDEYTSKHFEPKIPFAPFASLSMFDSRKDWLQKNHPNAPRVAPKGCNMVDVRWIPSYRLENQEGGETVACMECGDDFSTTWQLSLVGIQFDPNRLMVWVPEKNIWANFVIGANVSEAFASFLRAWF